MSTSHWGSPSRNPQPPPPLPPPPRASYSSSIPPETHSEAQGTGWEDQQGMQQYMAQQQQHPGGYEPEPTYAPSPYPMHPSQPNLGRRASLAHPFPSPSTTNSPHRSKPSLALSVPSAYPSTSDGAYVDDGRNGRKRGYGESFGDLSGGGGGDEAASGRYRRVASGSVVPRSTSPVNYGHPAAAFVPSGVESYGVPPRPQSQDHSPYASSSQPLQPTFLSYPSASTSNPNAYTATLPESSPYGNPQFGQNYDSSPAPPPSSLYSAHAPYPNPQMSQPPPPHYSQQPSQTSSQSHQSSPFPHSAFQHSPAALPPSGHLYQRAYSIDASAQRQLQQFAYRGEASPSSSGRTRPATSNAQGTYLTPSFTSHGGSSLAYSSAPNAVANGSDFYAPAPSPMFSHSAALPDGSSHEAPQQDFAQAPSYPQQSSYRPVTAPSYGTASRASPYSQQATLQPHAEYPMAEQQQYPAPVGAETNDVDYTSLLPPRPATSSGPSPTHSNFSSSSSHVRGSPPPVILQKTIPALQLASTERAAHRSSAPILAFNPAREPASTAKQRVQSEFGITYSVASSGSSKGKAKSVEVPAGCWTCGTHRAMVILRASDLTGFAPRLSFTCLDCLPVEVKEEENQTARLDRLAARAEAADRLAMGLPEEETAAESSGSGLALLASPTPRAVTPMSTGGETTRSMRLPSPSEHNKVSFKDTFSGAVDFLEGKPALVAGVGPDGNSSKLLLPPEETPKALPSYLKRQALTCDVCDRIIGAGSISALTQTPVPPFTVEVICHPCSEKYRPCSDCGGGGGRLTPGRWRCKELFPAGRRTCTLSHARNPPLSDIEYEIVRVTEMDPSRLENLENRCRLIYFNTRLRTQGRPEMLERADGLATTYAQCEKLTVDGWSLLKPLLYTDIEAERNIRRYVSIQHSTPHRRRAKPKPGALVKPEPIEDAVEKEVSGFFLVEHDFEKGAIFLAVMMPWAIAGDAFDATTVLVDETIKRIRSDVRTINAARVAQELQPYPEPWCIWGITPFKAGSRMTQSLSRRGLDFLEDYIVEHPETDLTCFPPHREIHIPSEFVKTFKIFIRSVTAEDGVGAPPSHVGGKSNGPKILKPSKPRNRKSTAAK